MGEHFGFEVTEVLDPPKSAPPLTAMAVSMIWNMRRMTLAIREMSNRMDR